jgi:hypothetical protein
MKPQCKQELPYSKKAILKYNKTLQIKIYQKRQRKAFNIDKDFIVNMYNQMSGHPVS